MDDRSGIVRMPVMKMVNDEHWHSAFKSLLDYLHRRYPRIRTSRTRQVSATPLQWENSKANIHQILSLFDPDLRPKINPLKSNTQTLTAAKTPITFKRLGARITTIAAFSRANGEKKRWISILSSTRADFFCRDSIHQRLFLLSFNTRLTSSIAIFVHDVMTVVH